MAERPHFVLLFRNTRLAKRKMVLGSDHGRMYVRDHLGCTHLAHEVIDLFRCPIPIVAGSGKVRP